jgi:hypothetical protein
VGRVPILHERVEEFGLAPFHAAKNDAIDIAKTQAAEIMAATSLAFYRVARIRFGWSPLLAGTVVGGFLVIDLAFLGANLLKFVDGDTCPPSSAAPSSQSWSSGPVDAACCEPITRLSRSRLPIFSPAFRIESTLVCPALVSS